MPDECKIGDAVESYREYYIKEKKHFSKWKNRKIPHFMEECLVNYYYICIIKKNNYGIFKFK